MRLPEVAARLRVLAGAHAIPELMTLADEIRRRPASRAPNSSATMTPALKAQIVAHAAANPAMTQAQIGRVFNVNPGRVSVALRGLRS